MENKQGIIKSVSRSEGVGNKGKWVKYEFTFQDGMKYSTFDEKIGTGFKAGDSVEMVGEQNGKYWNMKSMKSLNSVPGIVKIGAPSKPQEFHLSKEEVRLRALELAKNNYELAEEIEKWVLR